MRSITKIRENTIDFDLSLASVILQAYINIGECFMEEISDHKTKKMLKRHLRVPTKA